MRALAARGVARTLIGALGAVGATLLIWSVPVMAQVYARTGSPPFPHEKHAKLFPTCMGCHAGVVTGDPRAVMPPSTSCAECHDGAVQKRVSYTGAAPRHDFIRFVHRDHAARVEAPGRECSTCHGVAAPDTGWMVVRRAPAEACQSCHTHRAESHLSSDSRCANCHIAVARSQTLTTVHLATLPRPPSHGMERFVFNHAVRSADEATQCATCHTRDSCARCHVNAADVSAIAQLLPDARVAAMLRDKPVTYLTPTDHLADSWSTAHGRSASTATRRCAACHAQPSCTICHTGSGGREVIQRLPDGLTGTPGVQLVLPRRAVRVGSKRTVPSALAARHSAPLPASLRDTTRTVVRPHPAGYDRQHSASAASGRLTCEGCHAQRFCSDCHAGESKRGFHVANFVTRHAPESYGRDLECSSCHNTEVFCRGCHQAQGIAAEGRHAGAYHNGQPLWLLQHGQAARRGMQSCTTCHVQRDCLQCHSQRGWGVNPHGPGFDANRVGASARVMCARCHITDPTRRR